MIGFLIDALIIAALAFICYRFFIAFRANIGSIWDRVMKAGHDSAVMVWSYLQIAADGILTVIANVVGFFADPETTNQIMQYLPPDWLRWFLLFTAGVTILTRLRSLGKRG